MQPNNWSPLNNRVQIYKLSEYTEDKTNEQYTQQTNKQ